MRAFVPTDATYIPDTAQRVFQGIIFDVYQWQQEMFDGSYETFEMAKRADTVQIIAVHDGNIILTKEQQPHTDVFISLPAGMHDVPSENELQAAQREMQEETGCIFDNWKLIQAHQAGSGKIEHIVYTFLATDLENTVPQRLDSGEKIEVVTMSFQELKGAEKDPSVRFHPTAIMNKVDSLDELLALPSLFDYGN